MSIIVNNVTKVFGQQYALNKVSFEAKKGEIVGFRLGIGEDGSAEAFLVGTMICMCVSFCSLLRAFSA